MYRIRFVLVIVSIAMCVIILTPSPALSVVQRLSDGGYRAIVTRTLDYVQAQQQNSKWCWAAAVETVLDYHGINVSQSDIVRNAFGGLINRGGTPADINRGLTWRVPYRQGRGTVYRTVTGRQIQPQDIIGRLAASTPVIAGLRNPGTTRSGHAYVVYAMDYDAPFWARIGVRWGLRTNIRSVSVWNPWPGIGRQNIPWGEFKRRFTSAHTLEVRR